MKKVIALLIIQTFCLLSFSLAQEQRIVSDEIEIRDEQIISSPSSELSQSDAIESEEEAPAAVPEKKFTNPWLNIEENKLASFLSQNWFINNLHSRRTDIALAIAAASSENRKFRRDSELLLRDPGITAMYSSLCIFPRLLVSQTTNSVKALNLAATNVIERILPCDSAIDTAEEDIKTSITSMDTYQNLAETVEQKIADFTLLSRRRTTLSSLHSIIREQNLTCLESLSKQNREIQKLFSQHLLQLNNALLQINYLKALKEPAPIIVSSRLVKAANIIRDTLRNGKNYDFAQLDFAAKFKKIIQVQLAEMEKIAGSGEQNISNIKQFMGNFPARDLHIQKTLKFSFLPFLAQACDHLDAQYDFLARRNLVDQSNEKPNKKEFCKLLSHFDGTFSDLKNFKKLFSACYEDLEVRTNDSISEDDKSEDVISKEMKEK